ncbi:MAG: UDP-N-acetylmuramoyl-L-alanine--D-glutamate ligase [Patescibacteria group bacterium]
MIDFKNKKILIFGLGRLGGGISSTKWFYQNGAKLRITDLKTKKELQDSIEKLKNIKAKYILGKHRKEDFDWADIIVVNPAISYKNDFVKYAKEKGKEVVNDCYLFFKYAQGEIIALTGTRGKTTTTTWIYELLKAIHGYTRIFTRINADIDADKREYRKQETRIDIDGFKEIIIGGNQPDKSLLKIIKRGRKNSLFVLELSSFQLEFYEKNLKAPKIAIITNIYNDHLNRYESFEEYALTKAKIFQNQTENDYLILNYDNEWTKFLLNLKPKSKVYFVSFKNLPKNLKGIFLKNNYLFIRDQKLEKLFNIKKFRKIYGDHNVYNLMFALLAIYLYLKNINLVKKLKSKIYSLSLPPFREQIIYQSKNLIVINDSAATSPEATISAIVRFSKLTKNLILISGGTDKNLNFNGLAKIIKQKIKKENLILFNGSATKKLINELEKINYKILEENIFENLKDCLEKALKIKKQKSIILFSPGAASFEKFKNEFDRGKKFNKIVKSLLKI